MTCLEGWTVNLRQPSGDVGLVSEFITRTTVPEMIGKPSFSHFFAQRGNRSVSAVLFEWRSAPIRKLAKCANLQGSGSASITAKKRIAIAWWDSRTSQVVLNLATYHVGMAQTSKWGSYWGELIYRYTKSELVYFHCLRGFCIKSIMTACHESDLFCFAPYF